MHILSVDRRFTHQYTCTLSNKHAHKTTYVTFLEMFLYPLPTQLIITPSSSDRSLNTMPIISRNSRSNYPSALSPSSTATLVVVSGPVRIFDTSSGENAISRIASGW